MSPLSFAPDEKTILIVDDIPANVGILVEYLEEHHFRVMVAQDGEECIRRAMRTTPDLILLDVMMPGIDGFETCRRLKALNNTVGIPVIFMTALTNADEKLLGFRAGAVDYLTKPFQIEEILARINTHLALRTIQKQLESQNLRLQEEITVRRRAEASLLLTQYSIDHATDAVFWLTPEGRISYVNEAACAMTGYIREALLSMHLGDIDTDIQLASWPQHWASIKERRSYVMETRMAAKDGNVIPLETTVHYLEFNGQEHAFLHARDISERKRAEESLNESYRHLKEVNRKLEDMHQQLLQAEKMAAIGQLSAGVAHEINNPIAFVSSNLNTLQFYTGDLLQLIDRYQHTEKLLEDHPEVLAEISAMRKRMDFGFLRTDIQNLLGESLDGVQRVRRIVQDLKDFSRVGEVGYQLVDLHVGINSTLNIVASELGQRVDVRKEFGNIPQIEGIPAQLNQVFMSLIINAGQSIAKDGLIIVRTGHENGWVWIAVKDNGCGIAEDDLHRIFDPFFTTRPVGMGTGLGLSISYGVIARHGGRIEVDSKIGNGSTFTIWLPVKSPASQSAM